MEARLAEDSKKKRALRVSFSPDRRWGWREAEGPATSEDEEGCNAATVDREVTKAENSWNEDSGRKVFVPVCAPRECMHSVQTS